VYGLHAKEDKGNAVLVIHFVYIVGDISTTVD